MSIDVKDENKRSRSPRGLSPVRKVTNKRSRSRSPNKKDINRKCCGENMKQRPCLEKCKLIKCKTCDVTGPELYFDCHIDGHCTNCSIQVYAWSSKKLKYHTPGYCWYCIKKLVPIGLNRNNGRNHNDWDNRHYHKKCWKIKKNEEDERKRSNGNDEDSDD